MSDAAHDALREQVAAYAVGLLIGADRSAVAAHLDACTACAAEYRATLPVAAALAQIVPPHDPPPSLREAILADARRAAKSSRPMSALIPWLAAAAMLVLAAGLSLYAGELRQQVRQLQAQLRDALARIDDGERRLNVALREAQAPLAVLNAPDVRVITLAGQAAAPNASGRAYWSRSRGLLLTGANLPPLPPGRTYQLWFVRRPAPVSAGVMEPDASGQLRTVLNTPADIPDPEVLAITQEPAGGVPAPTGQMYLAGPAQ